MKAFEKAAIKNADMLKALESHGIPLVGVDPSMTLTYRQEYVQVVEVTPQVNLIQEWLATQSERIKERAVNVRSGEYKLLSHCTEKDIGSTVFTSMAINFHRLRPNIVCAACGVLRYVRYLWS